jgi:hypothetical protein
LLWGDSLPVCTQCGIPLTILHIPRVCLHYDEECQTVHLHSALNILGDDYHNMSNVSVTADTCFIMTLPSIRRLYDISAIPRFWSFWILGVMSKYITLEKIITNR